MSFPLSSVREISNASSLPTMPTSEAGCCGGPELLGAPPLLDPPHAAARARTVAPSMTVGVVRTLDLPSSTMSVCQTKDTSGHGSSVQLLRVAAPKVMLCERAARMDRLRDD